MDRLDGPHVSAIASRRRRRRLGLTTDGITTVTNLNDDEDNFAN
jgi:hypothetical protein